MAASVAAFSGAGKAAGQPAREGAARPDAAAPPGVRAAGDLSRRVALTASRLTRTGTPAYTDDFVLADVTLDERRRFWNFSGDTSGRYIEALAVLSPEGHQRTALAGLVEKLLPTQRPDGRFGRTGLAFTEAETGTEHMALLWGNGRLLVGLMAYYQVTSDPRVLTAARRLADFLLGVREAARTPAVIKRVEGQGAFGFICFTQLAEGLAMLSRATGERRYAEAGGEIVTLLPPRGVQHAHGYLSTLRGALMLHEAGAPGNLLAQVQQRYDDLVRSGDYTEDGGVMEYFGWSAPETRRRLVPAQDASGPAPRNEGCGLADFVRLSLQLYHATDQLDYLERAERCLVNGFDHNQFANGDFGSRVFFDRGIKPTESVDRAWWCCTMHGYRAYRDVLDHAVVEKPDAVLVQLFEDVDVVGRSVALSLRRTPFGVECRFARAFDGVLALRHPTWARRVDLALGGGRLETTTEGGFVRVTRAFREGDTLAMRFEYRLRLLAHDGRQLRIEELGNAPVRAALYCGPWLMAADERIDPYFFGEPWPGNVVTLPHNLTPRTSPAGRVHLAVTYEHDGFPGTQPVTLRPIGETPADEQKILAWSLNYRRG
jgi:DUF1680 family protein